MVVSAYRRDSDSKAKETGSQPVRIVEVPPSSTFTVKTSRKNRRAANARAKKALGTK